MKKIFLIIIFTLVVLGLGFGIFYWYSNRDATVEINGKKFAVELALTSSQQEKGLSNRNQLGADAGMLFVFSGSEIHSFWMKDTKIPLDVIWIENGKVVELTTLDPQTSNDFIPQYTPTNNAKYVLELNAGIAGENNIKVGDEVKIKY